MPGFDGTGPYGTGPLGLRAFNRRSAGSCRFSSFRTMGRFAGRANRGQWVATENTNFPDTCAEKAYKDTLRNRIQVLKEEIELLQQQIGESEFTS